MLLIVLAMIFVVVALTRPGPDRLLRGRYRRQPRNEGRSAAPDATAGLRDPTRPF